MESLAALSLASAIVQFVEFCTLLVSTSKRLYESGLRATPEHDDLEKFLTRLRWHRNHLCFAASPLGPGIKEQAIQLAEQCKAIAEELIPVLESIKVRHPGQRWSTLHAALKSVWKRSQIEDLQQRLHAISQESGRLNIVMLSHHVQENGRVIGTMSTEMASMKAELQEFRQMLSLSRQMPKYIGYPYVLEDSIMVDGGLGDCFPLPVSLCSTPKMFKDILKYYYETRNLPGKRQIQQGHFEVFNWDERERLNQETWLSYLKSGQVVKVSFIMGTWHGLGNKCCIRCGEARSSALQKYQKCNSCQLVLHYVEPDAFPYEPHDITVDKSKETYRDFLAGKIRQVEDKPVPEINESMYRSLEMGAEPEVIPQIPIDFVANRMTLKWSPIWNFVHRYLWCRCVIRLSTPAPATEELTIFSLGDCPRHNDFDFTCSDYGDLVNNHTDPYFDRFGGYDCFRVMVSLQGNMYSSLGREKFIDEGTRAIARKRWFELLSTDPKIAIAYIEYQLEVYTVLRDCGYRIPPEIEEELQGVEEQRILDTPTDFKLIFAPKAAGALPQSSDPIPMVEEVKEILAGKWSGKPHWRVE